MVAQHSEAAKIFADYYTKISRELHMKNNPEKYIRGKKQDKQLLTERTESSHKTTEKHSNRGKHHTSSDDKKATTRTIEVPNRPI